MTTQRIFLILFTLSWLPACSSVEGPVHAYAGQQRPESEIARLDVPAPITVVKVDGRSVDVPSKEDGFYEIFLLPGVHRIDFKYELSWGDPTSGMLVKSDVVGVESQFFAGKNYELTYAVPEEQEEAYDMALNFQAQLLEKETGRKVASRTSTELDKFRRQTSVVATANSSTQSKAKQLPTAETFGRTSSKDSQDAVAPAMKAAVPVPADIKANTAVREDAVKRLKFWWLMANKEERKLFKNWMKSLEAVDPAK